MLYQRCQEISFLQERNCDLLTMDIDSKKSFLRQVILFEHVLGKASMPYEEQVEEFAMALIRYTQCHTISTQSMLV